MRKSFGRYVAVDAEICHGRLELDKLRDTRGLARDDDLLSHLFALAELVVKVT